MALLCRENLILIWFFTLMVRTYIYSVHNYYKLSFHPSSYVTTYVYTDVKADRREIQRILRELLGFLSTTLGRKFELIKSTPRMVQFRYDRKIDVDLLISPFWSSRDELYQFMRTLHKDDRYK